jgi:glycosyltransferase involved in cell wall biosynthesis
MQFLFLPSSTVPFHGRTLEDRALGGTETGVIRLAQALEELGHEVSVISQCPNPPLTKPLYLPRAQLPNILDTDILVVVREWLPVFSSIRSKRRLFWTGDAPDQPQTLGLGDRRVVRAIDGLLTVSNWQADEIANASGFPRDKMWVVRNGVHPPYFEQSINRQRRRLIYSSTPYRGLVHLPRLFRRIREQVPDAELAVFSGYDVYADRPGAVPHGYSALVAELKNIRTELESIGGVLYSDSINQRDLAREFLSSSILAYPNTFAETGCITAMEAMRAGCVPVTTRLGALPETISDGGVLIDGLPGTPEYDDLFVSQSVKLLTDDEAWRRLSTRAVHCAKSYTWHDAAQRLLSFL